MTIIEFRAENVKKLSVVEFKPSPEGLVVVAGKNAAGKTSVLDTIEMVLAGADHIPSRPVRKGQEKATGELDLGEIVVKRTITVGGGGSLIVRNKEGAKLTSPQGILDELYGRLSFDPLAFARQTAAQRSATLRTMLNLDFSALDTEHAKLYDQRTVTNRGVASKKAIMEGTKRVPDVPAEEQELKPLLDKQSKAIEHNQANAEARRRADKTRMEAEYSASQAGLAKEACSKIRADIERLQREEKDAITRFDKFTADAKSKLKLAKSQKADADALVDTDTNALRDQIQNAEAVNAAVRRNKEYDQRAEDLKTAQRESDKLTRRLEAIEAEKRERLANAKFPVEGLSLSETNELLWNGIPFDSASTAEKLRVSVAMGLAMNPKLKVLLIRQGNDLDDENLALLAKTAAEAKCQVWLERVQGDGYASVIIEDGHIKDEAPPIAGVDLAKPGTDKTVKEEGALL